MATIRNMSPPMRAILSRCIIVIMMMAAFSGTSLAATTIEASGPIVEVTVFPDRAEVVREARVQVLPGASRVEFTGLPWLAERDSFRVSAEGVSAVLGIVEIRPSAEEPEESAELKAARAEVERLNLAIAVINARLETLKSMGEFLSSIRATTVARESEKLGEGTVNPDSIRAVYELVKSGLTDLSSETIAAHGERKELSLKLQVARARLAAARPAGSIRHLIAGVDVETRGAGVLTMRLEYLAPGASWRPAYRASLDAKSGKVLLESEAVVQQRTGEDWSHVKLNLSTASPARGVKPPELPPWLLRPPEIRALGGVMNQKLEQRRLVRAPGEPVLAETEVFKSGATLEYFADAIEATPAIRAQAGIVRSGYNLAFSVPGASEIPSDGSEHRVGLRQDELDSSVVYRATPAVNAAAYLVARTKMTTGYPLLAGPVRVFAGSAYLGTFSVTETGPGAELTFPFGGDNRVKVERVRLPQSRGRSGIFGKERRVAFGYRTRVTNNRARKIEIKIEDRVPVSEDDRIKVETEQSTTAGWSEVKDRPGVMEWTLNLEPGESVEVLLEYTVRLPKDMRLPGLD